ncbi:MAG: AMP-binding protein [Alcanivoracaceae bacterium]|nr:AMP-binding protein [Alcanivoracaceae bacterium]
MAQVIKKLLLDTLKTYPKHPALSIGENEYNYQQFLSPIIAYNKVLCQELKNEKAVAVLANKSLSGYQCIASTFIAGKTYVPLNLRYPSKRNAEIIIQAGIKTILIDSSCETIAEELYQYMDKSIRLIYLDTQENGTIKHRYVAAQNKQTTQNDISSDTAYLLFTSGSTGKPKGVPILDANIQSYLTHISQSYDFLPEDRFSQFFDFTFDLSLHDILVCWQHGACLCPANKMGLLMPLQFAKRQSISIWFSVPSLALTAKDLMRHRFESFRLETIRYSFFCGEALPAQLAKEWLKITNHATVINLYGPTEATIALTAFNYQNKSDDNMSVVQIGKPFGKNECQIMSTNGSFCPVGKKGELCLSGPQVFSGYLGRENSSLSAFHLQKTNTRENVYWYRTGDIASQLENGNYIYHGRNDRQVQVKGFRVELQEVEHQLRTLCSCGTLAVIAYPLNDIGEAVGLTAFIATQASENTQLFEQCKQLLPHYMLPDHFIPLDKFPYNASGKLDYKQLKSIAAQQIKYL